MADERASAAVAGARAPEAPAALDQALTALTRSLDGAEPTLVIAFVGAAHTASVGDITARLHAELEPEHLLGTTAGGVVAGPHELEDTTAISLWAARLPGARLTPLRYPAPRQAADEIAGRPAPAEWAEPPAGASLALLLADPVSLPASGLLSWLGHTRPGLAVAGGLASGPPRPGGNRLVLDREVFDAGAVGVALEGVATRTLVSQGCRPVGDSFTVTGTEGHLLTDLGGMPAVQRLRQIYADASEQDRQLLQAGVHIGIAIDEYKEELGRGDFLIRSVLGARQGSEALAVGERLHIGRTVRFHVRDAASADEDLRELLADLPAGRAHAGLLFTCNGRGERMFGEPDHDVRLVGPRLDDAPVAGFFCAGEFGPVGPSSFVHGFTASLVTIDDAPR